MAGALGTGFKRSIQNGRSLGTVLTAAQDGKSAIPCNQAMTGKRFNQSSL
jgi:hypothetical protein